MFRTKYAVVVILLATASVLAQEKKIQRGDLPPAVEKAVAAHTQGAMVRGFSQQIEKGQTFYEAETTTNGHSKDILFDSTGTVVEIEEQVAIDSLPAMVKAGLQARAGQAKILKVESLTRHDMLVAYEAEIQTTGTRKEIQIGPDGKPLAHEE